MPLYDYECGDFDVIFEVVAQADNKKTCQCKNSGQQTSKIITI